MKYFKIILIIIGILITIYLIRDYQRRIKIVNANYQCNVAGQLEYCDLLKGGE